MEFELLFITHVHMVCIIHTYRCRKDLVQFSVWVIQFMYFMGGWLMSLYIIVLCLIRFSSHYLFELGVIYIIGRIACVLGVYPFTSARSPSKWSWDNSSESFNRSELLKLYLWYGIPIWYKYNMYKQSLKIFKIIRKYFRYKFSFFFWFF